MSDLIKGLLSCILISIPETTFMTLLLIKFCGRKELLDIYRFRENIKWYILLIVPPSILMDIMNYGLKIRPRGISVIVCLLVLYFLIIYVFKKTTYEEIKYLKFKVFIRLIPLYLVLIILDLGNAIIWFKLLKLTYLEISKNFYLVLICSFSSRIIEFMIMTFILVNRNSKFQMNIIYHFYKNKFFKTYLTVLLILLLGFELYIVKLILYNNLLYILSTLIEQIFFVICFTYLIPSLVLTGTYILIKYCVNVIYSEKQICISSEDDISV